MMSGEIFPSDSLSPRTYNINAKIYKVRGVNMKLHLSLTFALMEVSDQLQTSAALSPRKPEKLYE
jgi:hypothetical protein